MADTRASFLFLHRTVTARGEPADAAYDEAGHAALTLHGHSRRDAQLGSIAALLAALLPCSSAAPLRWLHIGGFPRLSAAEVDGCPGLAAVRHLGVARCALPGGGGGLGGPPAGSVEEAAAVLAALLDQMPALQELDLTGWPGSSLPGCVAGGAAGVTRLLLAESGLTSLPCGACPAGELSLERGD